MYWEPFCGVEDYDHVEAIQVASRLNPPTGDHCLGKNENALHMWRPRALHIVVGPCSPRVHDSLGAAVSDRVVGWDLSRGPSVWSHNFSRSVPFHYRVAVSLVWMAESPTSVWPLEP